MKNELTFINPTRGFLEVDVMHLRHPEFETQEPIRADKGSAGYDFFSKETTVIHPGQKHLFWTDVKSYMKKNEVLELHIRSSLGIKEDLMLANTTGIIDSSYFENTKNGGNIGICLRNLSNKKVLINSGDRIAQGIFKNYLTTINDNVREEERTGGIGSSGR